jgi:hypothetical protein
LKRAIEYVKGNFGNNNLILTTITKGFFNLLNIEKNFIGVRIVNRFIKKSTGLMLHHFWARYAAFEPLETNRIKDTNEETQNN